MSSHHPQEVPLSQFSLYEHKCGLKPHSFHFILRGSTLESDVYVHIFIGHPPPSRVAYRHVIPWFWFPDEVFIITSGLMVSLTRNTPMTLNPNVTFTSIIERVITAESLHDREVACSASNFEFRILTIFIHNYVYFIF